jgi:hypothetical protein
MGSRGLRNPKASTGQSLIELTLILPVLLVLMLGVIDFARAIQLNNILVNMSREGANLAARTSYTPQAIITVLSSTASPMVMQADGMLYVTKLIGRKANPSCREDCEIEAKVEDQSRALSGDFSLKSRVWPNCGTTGSHWRSDGHCQLPDSHSVLVLAHLPMALMDGETVYAVEAIYNYNVIVGYMMTTRPELYSMTVL